MSDDNVTRLPVRPKPASDSPLTVVRGYGGCRHLRSEVNEKLAEVKCLDCGEKLNPIWVLSQLAQEDSILRDRWAGMRAEVRLLGERVRFKCRSCHQWNRITPKANAAEIRELMDRIKREESL